MAGKRRLHRIARSLSLAWQEITSRQGLSLVFKISRRNLFRHKGKSLIIGTIFLLGSLVMTAGNAVISGMENGLERNIVDGFIGDLVLVSTNQQKDNVMDGFLRSPITVLAGWTNTRRVLESRDYIAGFLPAARGFALVLEDDQQPLATALLGVDIPAYQRFFGTNLVVREGREPAAGERALMLTTGSRLKFLMQQNLFLVPEGDATDRPGVAPAAAPGGMRSLTGAMIPAEELETVLAAARRRADAVFLGFSDSNTAQDVRVPVRAIVEYRQLGRVWDGYDIIDIESFRECFNYLSGAEAAVELDAEKAALLEGDAGDLDAMFASDEVVRQGGAGMARYDAAAVRGLVERRSGPADLDAGSYNLAFIKLQAGVDRETALLRLNAALAAAGVDGRVVPWQAAAGQIADLASVIRVALFGFVFFIFFVAAIVITNTLSMSAIERTAELGMMRAVGAQKHFISLMFGAETAMLSVVFGTIGMLAAGVLVAAASGLAVSGSDAIIQLFFGGDTFRPEITFASLLFGVVQLVVVSVLAVIYPVVVARRITPLEAIARD